MIIFWHLKNVYCVFWKSKFYNLFLALETKYNVCKVKSENQAEWNICQVKSV